MYLLNIDGLDQVEKMHFSKKKKAEPMRVDVTY